MPDELENLKVVSSGGMLQNFKKYMVRVTGSTSFFRYCMQGFILSICTPLPSIFAAFLRGMLYRLLLGGSGKSCLIERNVTFHLPGRIFLSDHVVIQENTVLDPFHREGRIVLKSNVQISRNGLLKSGRGSIEIDESVYVGPNAVFYGIGGIHIGCHCLIANNVQLLSGDHVYEDKNRLIKTQGAKNRPIEIGEDVWLGASVIVLGGVTIGKGAVVGAGSLVRNDIPEYGIAVGNPARVVKMRG